MAAKYSLGDSFSRIGNADRIHSPASIHKSTHLALS
jgi:hypothetical protein